MDKEKMPVQLLQSGRFEVVIGLEIHAQMLTNTKIFCGCSTVFGKPANTQTCPVCIGMPGVLPVINEKVVEFAVKAGLSLNCDIARFSRFARKNYFYPDLPKGYQISQYELPICNGGYVYISEPDVDAPDGQRKIGITRIHMEEDAGKNIHEGSEKYSFVDLNRAGVPLIEIVTEPDLKTPLEAALFMKKLRSILRYLCVCDGNMEQGSLRCDANVSLKPIGQKELGVKTEIKNINSFKFVEKALEYEIRRQEKVLVDGGHIVQETRLWDVSAQVTKSMRSKEEAHDYRYFPEPDLVPIVLSDDWIEKIRADLPELPDNKADRFRNSYNLPIQDVEFLVAEQQSALWFEEAVKLGANPKAVCNWMMGQLTKLLNETGCLLEDSPVTPSNLCGLLKHIDKGTISGKIAKTVFEEMFKTSKDADTIIKEKGLLQISDEGEIEKIVEDVIKSNEKEITRYKGGETKLLGFFVGQVMKRSKGKANPKVVNELVKKKLDSQ